MDIHFRLLAREFMNRGHAPDYAELQWQRGFFAGIKFLLDTPDLEAKRLARALAREQKDGEGS